ncbi:MAG: respiratory nitrate reductase subunit gamma, partial [Alphaproteobacteria bacterium]
IRRTSTPMDIAILLLIYGQLILGLVSIWFSAQHPNGETMVALADWAQRIVTFRAGSAAAIEHVDLVYKLHLVLGLTIFLLFPFSRLVHIWSAPVWYLGRPYQIVRRRLPRGYRA